MDEAPSTPADIVNQAWNDSPLAIAKTLSFLNTIGTEWTDNAGYLTLDGTDANDCFYGQDVDGDLLPLYPDYVIGGCLFVHCQLIPASSTDSTQVAVSLGAVNSDIPGFRIYYDGSNDRIRWYAAGTAENAGDYIVSTSNSTVTEGTECSVSMVINGADKTLTGYLDGAATAATDISVLGEIRDPSAAVWGLCIGNFAGAAPSGSSMYLGQIRRLTLARWDTIPSNMSDIVAEFNTRNGVPGRQFLQS